MKMQHKNKYMRERENLNKLRRLLGVIYPYILYEDTKCKLQ